MDVKISRLAGTVALAAAMLFVFFLPSFSRAQIYKYKDKQGSVHVVRRLADVPPEYRDQVEEVEGTLSKVSFSSSGEDEGPSIFSEDYLGPDRVKSPAGIIMAHLFKSRLIISLVGAVLLTLLFLFGFFLAKDVVEKGRRLKYWILLPLSWSSVMVTLWLAFAGPATIRFLEGLESHAGSVLVESADPEVRQNLAALRDGSYDLLTAARKITR